MRYEYAFISVLSTLKGKTNERVANDVRTSGEINFPPHLIVSCSQKMPWADNMTMILKQAYNCEQTSSLVKSNNTINGVMKGKCHNSSDIAIMLPYNAAY